MNLYIQSRRGERSSKGKLALLWEKGKKKALLLMQPAEKKMLNYQEQDYTPAGTKGEGGKKSFSPLRIQGRISETP